MPPDYPWPDNPTSLHIQKKKNAAKPREVHVNDNQTVARFVRLLYLSVGEVTLLLRVVQLSDLDVPVSAELLTEHLVTSVVFGDV